MNYYPFLDLAPLLELQRFVYLVISVALVLLALRYSKQSPGAALGKLLRLLDRKKIITKQAFATQLVLLNVIRIIVGLLWFARTLLNLQTYMPLHDSLAIAACLVGAILAAMIAAGFITPVACIALAISQNIFIDTYSHTNCLPSQVLSLVLWTLALVPAGTVISLDAAIAQSKTFPGRLISALYSTWGPSPLSLIAARTLALVGYSALHFSSGLMHMQTPSWQQGWVNMWVLTDPVLSPGLYQQGIWLLCNACEIFVAFAKLSTWLTAFTMVTFLPLFLASSKTRKFVVAIELAFLIFSCFGIAVRLLGWVQLLLLSLILLDRLALITQNWLKCTTKVQELRIVGKLTFWKTLFLCSFAISIVCFILRQPALTSIQHLKMVTEPVRLLAHRSALAFGLREVNAFNFPMNKLPYGVFGIIRPLNQDLPYLWLPASQSSNMISDAVFYQSINGFAGVDKQSGRPTLEQICQLLLLPGIKSALGGPSSTFSQKGCLRFYRYNCPSVQSVSTNSTFVLKPELTGQVELDLTNQLPTLTGLLGETIKLSKLQLLARTRAGEQNLGLSQLFSLRNFEYSPKDSNDFLDCLLFDSMTPLAKEEFMLVKVTLPKRLPDEAYGVYAIEDENFKMIRCWNPPYWTHELVCCLTADELHGATRLVMIGKHGAAMPLPTEIQISKYKNISGIEVH